MSHASAGGSGKINRQWHAEHKMPGHPSFEERMHWHLQHAANCGCRPMPAKLREEMIARGYSLVTPRSLK